MEEEQRRGVNPNIPLPQEIVEDIILVKLPVKSLGRFKAVSREWRGAIDSNRFVEKHMRYQKSLQGSGQARLVTIPSGGKGGHKRPLQNLLLTSNGILQYASPYPPIRSFLRVRGFKFSASCDGLFCLYTKSRKIHLVNPATTSHRVLPNPVSINDEVSRHSKDSLVGIGRDNSASLRYKLVCYFNGGNIRDNNSTRCKVFALDSSTWRHVDDPHVGRVHYDHPMMHLDGVIYSLSYCYSKKFIEQDHKVLAFDLHTETFQSFPITPDIRFTHMHDLCMRVLNHRICILKRDVGNDDLFFKIWGLDINKRSWEIMYSIDASCIPPEFKRWKITPIATINNYVILSNSDSKIWGHSGSKNKDFLVHRPSPCHSLMSYVDTLVSTYQ